MSSIGGISSFPAMNTMSGMQRPDPSQMAKNLFSKLDSSGKGYLEKSDLQAALDQTSSRTQPGTSSTNNNVDALFQQMDGDGDGKVTQQEMTDTLTKITSHIDTQMTQARMQGHGPGGMPPPPPPSDNSDEGFTQEQLTAMAQDVGSTDSEHASLFSILAENFDSADTNGDSKVNREEVMSFNRESSVSKGTSSNASASTSDLLSEQIAKQILQLMQAYGLQGTDNMEPSLASSLSISA